VAGSAQQRTWLVVVALLGVVALVGNGFTLVPLACAVGGVLSRIHNGSLRIWLLGVRLSPA